MITEYNQIELVNEDGHTMTISKDKDQVLFDFSQDGFSIQAHEIECFIDALRKVAGDQK